MRNRDCEALKRFSRVSLRGSNQPVSRNSYLSVDKIAVYYSLRNVFIGTILLYKI